MLDPYYSRIETSNSDLSEVFKMLNPTAYDFDFENALRFGNLFDCLVTELHKVNVYNRTVEGIDGTYSIADFELAREMKKAFYKDATCAALMKIAECQKISVGMVQFQWNNFKFELAARAKWDIWLPRLNQGADIKTTTATTQKQFEEACHHFGYFRSRYYYMRLENCKQDMLIGVSKINKKIFKIPISMGDKLWKVGEQQANELAFSYWHLFSGFGERNLQIS